MKRTMIQTHELVVPKSIPITSPRSIGAIVAQRFVIMVCCCAAMKGDDDVIAVVSCCGTIDVAATEPWLWNAVAKDDGTFPERNVENSLELLDEPLIRPILLLRRKLSCKAMIRFKR